MDPEPLARVGAAAGGLADDGGPAELLEVVAELLAAGERGGTRQHVHGLVLAEAATWNVRQRPGLPEQVVLAVPKSGELGGVAVPQVADEERDHAGLAAQAVAQVDDERVCGREQAHRGGDDLPAEDRREQDRLQVEGAHTSGNALSPHNA